MVREILTTSDDSIDDRVQGLVALHFDDDHGAPYWVQRKAELSFDPQEDINGLNDLVDLFGREPVYDVFPQHLLRTQPRAFVPQDLEDGGYEFFSTGGRTGKPKWTAWVRDGGWQDILDIQHQHLDAKGIRDEGYWAFLGPTGPHAVGYNLRNLAALRGTKLLTIDIDPRWFRVVETDHALRCQQVNRAYADHLVAQARDLFDTFGEHLGVLVATSEMIRILMNDGVLADLDLTALVWAGQAMQPEDYLALDQRLGCHVFGLYGSTLFGPCMQEGFDRERASIAYPQPATAVIEIVSEESLETGDFEVVGYGDRGRTGVHVLREGLFAPFLAESDAADRLEPLPGRERDAIGNPDIPASKRATIEPGVY